MVYHGMQTNLDSCFILVKISGILLSIPLKKWSTLELNLFFNFIQETHKQNVTSEVNASCKNKNKFQPAVIYLLIFKLNVSNKSIFVFVGEIFVVFFKYTLIRDVTIRHDMFN